MHPAKRDECHAFGAGSALDHRNPLPVQIGTQCVSEGEFLADDCVDQGL